MLYIYTSNHIKCFKHYKYSPIIVCFVFYNALLTAISLSIYLKNKFVLLDSSKRNTRNPCFPLDQVSGPYYEYVMIMPLSCMVGSPIFSNPYGSKIQSVEQKIVISDVERSHIHYTLQFVILYTNNNITLILFLFIRFFF